MSRGYCRLAYKVHDVEQRPMACLAGQCLGCSAFEASTLGKQWTVPPKSIDHATPEEWDHASASAYASKEDFHAANSNRLFKDICAALNILDYDDMTIVEAALKARREIEQARKNYCPNCHCSNCRPECHGLKKDDTRADRAMSQALNEGDGSYKP